MSARRIQTKMLQVSADVSSLIMTPMDGTADCNDDCMLDPDKTEPVVALLPIQIPIDGTPDCQDEC